MASWNIPALINKISEDVPAIKALLTALFKWTDAGTEDVPEGAKRLQSVTGGRQIQEYSGSSWGSVGKLMHDVDMLDGKHASTAQTPDTIPVRDANGSITGNITGNAATATTASSVSSEYVVPIANGGTGATSAANARTNLGANNAENITQGVLATARGGTGRNDGKVTDVFLTDYQTGAVGLGQLGQAVTKDAVNADSLTRTGKFYCTNATLALNYPYGGTWCLEVTQHASRILQRASTLNNSEQYYRTSEDNGASWTGWIAENVSYNSNVHIFIAKNGSDSYSGLSATAPVLTVTRALQIARGCRISGDVFLRFGPGEWGDVSIFGSTINCSNIYVTNFTYANASTVEAYNALSGNDTPPHFSSLDMCLGRFCLGAVSADRIFIGEGQLHNVSTFSFGRFGAGLAYVNIGTHIIRKVSGINEAFYFEKSMLFLYNASNAFVDTPNFIQFIVASLGSDIFIHKDVSYSGSCTGKKYVFLENITIGVDSKHPDNFPGNAGGEGNFSIGHGEMRMDGEPIIALKNRGLTRGTAPSYTQWLTPFRFLDSTHNPLFCLYYTHYNNQANEVSLLLYKGNTSQNKWDTLGIGFTSDGTAYAWAPTTDYGADNSHIVTTNWIRNATGNTTLKAANVTGTVAIANGGTGATTRLAAIKNLTNENVGTAATHLLGLKSDWSKVGYLSTNEARQAIGAMPVAGGTMTGDLVLEEANTFHSFYTDDGVLNRGTAPSNTIYRSPFNYRDKNNRMLAMLYGEYYTDKSNWFGLLVYKYATTNSGDYAKIGIGYNTNGDAYTFAPNPPATSNDSSIATTAWVRGRLGNGEFGMVPQGPWQWLSTNTTYNASSNGYVYARNSKYSSCGQSCKITVNKVEYWMQNTSYGSGSCNSDNVVIVPIKKGWPFRGNNLDVVGFLPA